MTARSASRPRRIISQTARSVLRRMHAGERVAGTRCFPHPFRFTIGPATNSESVSDAVIAALIEHQLIDASPRAPSLSVDTIRYRVTDAGVRFLTESPPVSDTQLDLTEAGRDD